MKGVVFFAAIVGPLVLGTELDLTMIGAPLGIPLDLGGFGLWAFCAYDAYRTARMRRTKSSRASLCSGQANLHR